MSRRDSNEEDPRIAALGLTEVEIETHASLEDINIEELVTRSYHNSSRDVSLDLINEDIPILDNPSLTVANVAEHNLGEYGKLKLVNFIENLPEILNQVRDEQVTSFLTKLIKEEKSPSVDEVNSIPIWIVGYLARFELQTRSIGHEHADLYKNIREGIEAEFCSVFTKMASTTQPLDLEENLGLDTVIPSGKASSAAVKHVEESSKSVGGSITFV